MIFTQEDLMGLIMFTVIVIIGNIFFNKDW